MSSENCQKLLPGLNLREEHQQEMLHLLRPLLMDFPYGGEQSDNLRFSLNQEAFGEGDAQVLFGMLRFFKPRQVIEVGSGHTSALMLDTNERFLNRQTTFKFIDPDTKRLHSVLSKEDAETNTILRCMVQNVSVDEFSKLEKNDFLFIDSSHICAPNSDVWYLLFEVLPKLKSGVVIHFHDIFWPFIYPNKWIDEGLNWNEGYFLRTLLQDSSRYEVVLFNNMHAHLNRELLENTVPGLLKNSGGSLWLQIAH